MFGLIFVVQIGLIYWLGSRTPIRPLPPSATLTLHLGGLASAELQALTDPTLFTLPHPEGLVGPVWRGVPRPEFRPFQWSAPTDRLPQASDRLSAGFNQLFETNEFPGLQIPALIEASPTLPALRPLPVSSDQSVAELEDSLVRRRLLAPLELKSWPNPDILANSVVRVGVDAAGRPVSVTLLSGSGVAEADQYALDRAWAARFEPFSRNPAETGRKPATGLTWGRMIFRWHTVPMPSTNAPAAKP
jgi:hypothetical protein